MWICVVFQTADVLDPTQPCCLGRLAFFLTMGWCFESQWRRPRKVFYILGEVLAALSAIRHDDGHRTIFGDERATISVVSHPRRCQKQFSKINKET